MAAKLLLDTGALVALIDRSEKRHKDCVAVFENWDSSIFTTEAVLTEALYLLNAQWRWQKICLEFFTREAFMLVPASASSLDRVSLLMERYRNVPMDFADATLVSLAEEINADTVFTLDRRGFETYRIRSRKPFQIVPN